MAPGKLLGVGVGVETLPRRTQSPPPSRSQYNSRASPHPSPPRSPSGHGQVKGGDLASRAPYAGHPMAGVPLVASNALVIGLPAGEQPLPFDDIIRYITTGYSSLSLQYATLEYPYLFS